MEKQKWTLKQVLFEKELNYKIEPLYINGFELPKDKEFLLKVLDELFKIYPTGFADSIKNIVRERSQFPTSLSTQSISIFKGEIRVAFLGKKAYPIEKVLMFTTGGTKTYLFGMDNYETYYIYRGLHIHKDCLELSNKEIENESTKMDC